jgi:hypothetical protein
VTAKTLFERVPSTVDTGFMRSTGLRWERQRDCIDSRTPGRFGEGAVNRNGKARSVRGGTASAGGRSIFGTAAEEACPRLALALGWDGERATNYLAHRKIP